MLATSERVSLSLGSAEWPMPQRFVWAWLVAVAACWWAAATILLPQAVASQLGRTSPAAVPLALALSVLGRFAGFGIEAGFYYLWWKVQQRRVRPACFFAWIVTFSLLDFLGMGLGRLASHHSGASPWLAPVAGIGLLRSRWPDLGAGAWAGFGTAGLLTGLRIYLTARQQARALRSPLAGPLALTLCAWLLTRVAVWWGVDLLRGMSPVK